MGLILFNETAALFMMNKIRGTSQLNIDIIKFILFIEPKYCIHIIDHTIFIIFLLISVSTYC